MTSSPGSLAERGKPPHDPYDFSMVLGGPLFQLARRAHLCGDALELLNRRIVVITLFLWLPLLILSILDGHAWGSAVKVPFLKDIEVHVRLLVALPLLILAELIVHLRMRATGRQFLERGLIADPSRAKFGMRTVPFTKNTIIQLAVITLLPVAPLTLTMISAEEILKSLLKVIL